MMNSPNYTRAIFVRDPKQRFVSAYFDKSYGRRAWYVRGHCCIKDKSKSRAMRRECVQLSNSFAGFVNLRRTCRDNHWDLQSSRMSPKYLKSLNFVGHMESLQQDAKALLHRIGAWEKFGRDGWGLYGNESIFASKSGVDHANNINLTAFLLENLTADIEKELNERFAPDYNVKGFNLTLKALSLNKRVWYVDGRSRLINYLIIKTQKNWVNVQGTRSKTEMNNFLIIKIFERRVRFSFYSLFLLS